MGWRHARQGTYLRLKSMATEKNPRPEPFIKKRITKEDRPINSWDDVWVKSERSWKRHRKHQAKEFKAPVAEKRTYPLPGTPLLCLEEDKAKENWKVGEIYHLVEVGYWFHDNTEKGMYITNEFYYYDGFLSDTDYCTFIPEEDFYKCFAVLEY